MTKSAAEGAVTDGVADDPKMRLVAHLQNLLSLEERHWRSCGNEARAERYAVVRRIVDEEAARSGGRPSPLLNALAEMYGAPR